jgi:hypothetical protein
MSFGRVINISGDAYPEEERRRLITIRRLSDVADTESIASSDRFSDDASDDGIEISLDHHAHALRCRNSRARINDSLQYVRNRLKNRVQSAQTFADGTVDHSEYLYIDLAEPRVDWHIFETQVSIINIYKLLWRLLYFIVESTRLILEALLILLWYLLSIPCNLLLLIVDMAELLFEFLLIFFRFDLRRSSAVRQLMRLTLHSILQGFLTIPYSIRRTSGCLPKLIAASSGLAILSLSTFHGSKGVTLHTCNHIQHTKNWSLPVLDVCKHTDIAENIKIDNAVLANLLNASDTVLKGISQLAYAKLPNSSPGRQLLAEASALLPFAGVHHDQLHAFTRPRHRGRSITTVANAIYNNVTAYNTALEIFHSEATLQIEELELKAKHIHSSAKKLVAPSSTERFFLSSLFYFFPPAFFHTAAARTTTAYITMAKHFLNSSQTTSLLGQSASIAQTISDIAEDVDIAKEAMEKYQPVWRVDCENVATSIFCDEDPSELLQRLGDALVKSQVEAAVAAKIHALNRVVIEGLAILQKELPSLLQEACSPKSDSARPLFTRGILLAFARHVGKVAAQ